MARWHTPITLAAVASSVGCGGAADSGSGEADSGGISTCTRSYDPIDMRLDGPEGPVYCFGEYPSFPPLEFEGQITETTPISVRIDGCPSNTGCAPSLFEPAGGDWSVRNLHSYRNETPCAASGCAYSEFDDIGWFIAWSPGG